MTPTGSWPIVRPLLTGYSPLRMCTSVPQIVVVRDPDQRVERADIGHRLRLEDDPTGFAKMAAFIFGIDATSQLTDVQWRPVIARDGRTCL